MKQRTIEYSLAWLLLAILAFIVIHAPLTVVVGTQFPSLADVIKTWKEWFLLVAFALTLVEVSRRHAWNMFTSDILCWLILAYGALHIGALAWTTTTLSAVLAGLAIDLRYVLYFVLVYMFLRLYPQYWSSFVKIAALGAAIVVGFATIQLWMPHDALKHLGYGPNTIAPYLTVDKNPDYIRLNSTLRGPNPLGAYVTIVMAGVTAYMATHRTWWRNTRQRSGILLLAIMAILALWNSYSRSALVAGLVGVAAIAVIRYGRRIRMRAWYGIAAIVVAGGLLVVGLRETSFVQNVVLHDNPTTGAAVDSNEGHMASLQHGIERMLTEPMGVGVGTTGSASLLGNQPTIIENQYLMIAHEVGWLGLTLFVAIYSSIINRLWQLRQSWYGAALWASGIALALIGLLLPVWADDTIGIVWWGLAGAVIAKGATHGTTTNKKAA